MDTGPRARKPRLSVTTTTQDNNLQDALGAATKKFERLLSTPSGKRILKEHAQMNQTSMQEAKKSLFVKLKKQVETKHQRLGTTASGAGNSATKPEPTNKPAAPSVAKIPLSKQQSSIKVELEPTTFRSFPGRRMEAVNSPARPDVDAASVSLNNEESEDLLIYCAVLIVSLRGQREEAAVSPMTGAQRWNSSTQIGRLQSDRVRGRAIDSEMMTVTTSLCQQTHTTQVFGEHNEMRFECHKEELASNGDIQLYGKITSGVLRNLGHFQVDIRPMALRMLKALRQDTVKGNPYISEKVVDNAPATQVRRFPVLHYLPSGAEVEVGTVEISFRVGLANNRVPSPVEQEHMMAVRHVDSDDHSEEEAGRESANPTTMNFTRQHFMSAQQILQARPYTDWDLVEVLDLSHNWFEVLSPLYFAFPVMHNLRELCLAHNRMRQLMLDCFSCCPCLEVLDLSDNNIKRIGDGLLLSDEASSRGTATSALPALTSLNLSGNELKGVRGLESLRQLKELNLSSNFIAKSISMRSLSLNSKLTHLWLDGNPMAQSRACRGQVCNLLPKLEQLDGRSTPSYALRMRAEKSSNRKISEKTRWGGVKRQKAGPGNSNFALANRFNTNQNSKRPQSQKTAKSKRAHMGSYSKQAQRPARNNEAMRRLLKPSGSSGRSQRMRVMGCNQWVSIVVSSAENLLNFEGQPADPFITLRHGKVTRQTDTLHHTCNPNWKEGANAAKSSAIADWSLSSSPPLTVPVVHEANDMPDLEVMAWDEDRRTGDTLLGRITLKLEPLMREVIKARAHTKRIVTKRFRLRTTHQQKIAPLVVLAFAVGKSAADAKRAHGPRTTGSGKVSKRFEYLSKPRRKVTKSETLKQNKRTAFGSTYVKNKFKQQKRTVLAPPRCVAKYCRPTTYLEQAFYHSTPKISVTFECSHRPPSMMLRGKPEKKITGHRPAWGAGAGNRVRRKEPNLQVEKMNRQIVKLTNLHSMVCA